MADEFKKNVHKAFIERAEEAVALMKATEPGTVPDAIESERIFADLENATRYLRQAIERAAPAVE